MTFTSFEFLLFFPLVVLFFNLVPKKTRVWYLLAVSYLFYALLQPVYLLLLLLVTLITYGVTRWIGIIGEDNKRRKIQILGIVLVVLPLFFFKYFNFVNEALTSILSVIGATITMPSIKWLLPVGISFYTFMAIGYIVDAYNEEVEVEKNIGSVGLFLSFFPIILSGPIERAGNMLPQIKDLQRSSSSDLTSGLKMMLWGYFMKLCVADRLGLYVDAVFGNIAQHNGVTLVFASVLYIIQEYADFAGYSLIAIGTARCMGMKIMTNFNRPFFATSISEFWRRWHISLIEWMTDYIYTPLSFALRSWKSWGIVISLMLTFFVSGIWHSATMTFVVWGLIQGAFLSIEALLQNKRGQLEEKYKLNKNPLYIVICCLYVFMIFTTAEVIAKCATIEEAGIIMQKIFSEKGSLFIDKNTLVYAALMFVIMAFKDIRDEYFPNRLKLFESKYTVVRYVSYLVILLLILNFGVLDAGQFIYFQF